MICSHVSKAFPVGRSRVVALEDVSFHVARSEFVCIIGSSGCGKTTLLRLVAGLIAPTSGTIDFENPPADGHLRTALVFQEHGLLPWLSVVDNVSFGLRLRGTGRRERRQRARDVLERFGLGACLDLFPHQISAGMRQRANIARSFLADAEYLLMDEPFGALDALTKLALQQELIRNWEGRQNAVMYVTHDLEEAVLLADRVIVMKGGGDKGGRIHEDIAIRLPRPRDLTARKTADVTDLTWHIWSILEDDVRKRLSIPTSRPS